MKITPKIENKYKTVDYQELKQNAGFMYGGDLYIKHDVNNNQGGLCLTDDNGYVDDMCDTQVIPVDLEVIWSYKSKKSTKGKPK